MVPILIGSGLKQPVIAVIAVVCLTGPKSSTLKENVCEHENTLNPVNPFLFRFHLWATDGNYTSELQTSDGSSEFNEVT